MNSIHLLTYFLIVLLCSQGIGLLFTLWQNTKRRTYTYVLFGLVLVIMTIVFSVILQRQPYIRLPHLTLVHQPLIFTIFPLFYLFISTLMNERYRLTKSRIFHFAIPVFIAANLLPFYLAKADNKTVEFALENQIFYIPWWWHLFILCLQGFAYLFASAWFIRKNHETLSAAFTDVKNNLRPWVKGLFILFTALFVSASLRLASNYIVDTQQLSLLLLSAVIIVIGSGFRWTTPDMKYAGSNLSLAQSRRHLDSLLEVVTREKLFKNEKLSVNDLSQILEVSPHHISQVINQELKMNFWDFINQFRIEEAKNLLGSEDNPKILRVAYESGFHSKSAFYAAFKKHTGQTPTQFKNTKKKS